MTIVAVNEFAVPDHAFEAIGLQIAGRAFDEATGDYQSNVIVFASLASVG